MPIGCDLLSVDDEFQKLEANFVRVRDQRVTLLLRGLTSPALSQELEALEDAALRSINDYRMKLRIPR